MAVTAETRTHLIGLSVAMLGQAPGTALLNEWVGAVDEGKSLEDIANHIAASDAFQTAYPTFLTNEEFAEAFLGSLMSAADVSAALMSAAVEIVVGLLNDGMSRGALALAAVQAMNDIATQGMSHPAYGDLGQSALAFHNKVEVAEYYTIDLRESAPSARVLRGVDSETGLADVMDSISDRLDPPEPIRLTSARDNIEGTAANDLILSEPDSKGADTLNRFDSIDGGAGSDTLQIYSTTGIDIDTNGADVMNVENVFLSARAAIDVDLSGWKGLESVEIDRFGNSDNVTVKVDGASVSSARDFGGDVHITGASGEVSLTAAKTSDVDVSGKHTTSVMVKNGMTVDVNSAAAASDTVTVVSVDGAQRDLGKDNKLGTTEVKTVTVRDNNDSNTTTDHTAAKPQYVMADGTAVANSATGYYLAADQTKVDEGVTLSATQDLVTTVQADAKGYADSADGYSVRIYSKAIEHVSLSNTDALVLVDNGSAKAEDLKVTVGKFGKHAKSAGAGKLSLAGKGAAENLTIDVTADSEFALNAGSVKSLEVSGAGKLTLDADGAMLGKLETLTLSGGGRFTAKDASGMSKLKTVDASAAGEVVIEKIGASLSSYEGGAAFDCIEVTDWNTKGVTIDLGAGDDAFKASGGHAKASVDGGAGAGDVLHLMNGAGSVQGTGSKAKSIYENFEILDVGGGQGTYDIGKLGVSTIRQTSSSADSDDDADGVQPALITLMDTPDDIGIAVHAKEAGMGTTSIVTHSMATRKAGAARYSGELDVSLLAIGGATDSNTDKGTNGEVILTLAVDTEIDVLKVDSNANAGGSKNTAAATRPSAGHYDNELTLTLDHDNDNGTTTNRAASIEVIEVGGNAGLKLMLGAAGAGNLSTLEKLDATANSGGVTFDGSRGDDSALAQELELLGGSGMDTLTGGDAADEINGGAGGDMLDGGGTDGEEDKFMIDSASESMVAGASKTDHSGYAGGYDTIVNFESGTDKIVLSKSLFAAIKGNIKNTEAEWDDWMRSTPADDSTATNSIDGNDVKTDNGAMNLKTFIGDGKKLFQSTEAADTTADIGSNTKTVEYSVAIVEQDNDDDENNGLWLLFDVDGDGDFNAAKDMVIFLAGAAAGGFAAGDLMEG